MKFIYPIFNSDRKPTKILRYIQHDGKNLSIYNIDKSEDTPYYSFETKTIEEFYDLLKESIYIFDKKLLYRYFKNKQLYSNVYDVDGILWTNDIKYNSLVYNDYKYEPLNKIIQHMEYIISLFDEYKLHDTKHSNNLNYIIFATSVLALNFSLNGLKIKTEYDYRSKTGRLMELNHGIISTKKEDRENLKTSGIKIELDLDGAHLRIIDLICKINMIPKSTKAVDWMIKNSNNTLDKTKIYTMLYSESFRLSSHPFFIEVAKHYKSLTSPLGRKHNDFNYIIQEYEVLVMSKLIYNLFATEVLFYFYMYDGLIFSVHPNYINIILSKLKEIQEFPLKVKIAGQTFFVHNENSVAK